MFETGQKYEFVMIKGGEETMFWGTIESYEHPLIKLADHETKDHEYLPSAFIPGEIINVTSPNFISAVVKLDREMDPGALKIEVAPCTTTPTE